MAFKKKKENFTCDRCGELNIGDGYTNHCKKCLWSKHVDIDPGDRIATCYGMMEPIEISAKNGENKIFHKCQSCGFTRSSPILSSDDFSEVIKIAETIAKKSTDLLSH